MAEASTAGADTSVLPRALSFSDSAEVTEPCVMVTPGFVSESGEQISGVRVPIGVMDPTGSLREHHAFLKADLPYDPNTETQLPDAVSIRHGRAIG